MPQESTPRTLSELISDQASILQEGALSSQLSAAHVQAWAGLALQAQAVMASRLEAINPEAAAQVVEAADLLAAQVAQSQADAAAIAGNLLQARADLADAAAAVEALRSEVASLRDSLQVQP